MKIDWWKYISSNNHKITEFNKQEPIIIKDGSNNNNNCQQIFQIRSINDEDKFYGVDADIKTCTCPDFNYRLLKCKHLIAAEFGGELTEGIAAA